MNPFSISIVGNIVSVGIISTSGKTAKTPTVVDVTQHVSTVALNYGTLSVTFIASKDSPLSVEDGQLLLHGKGVDDVAITGISVYRTEPTIYSYTAEYETPKPV